MNRRLALFALSAGLVLAASPLCAEEVVTYEVTLSKDVFTPAEIKVPAGKPFMLKMVNANAKPAELESHPMKVEKIAPANATIVVRVRAMEPGKYLFVDEFQEATAKAYVIVE